MTKKKSFILFLDSLDILDDLTDEQSGQLFRAIRAFEKGEEIDLPSIVKVAFSPIKNHLQRCKDSYDQVSEERSKAGKEGARKRWGKIVNDSKNSKCHNVIANDSKVCFDTDTDTDTDKDNDNDNDNIIISKEITEQVPKKENIPLKENKKEITEYIPKEITIEINKMLDALKKMVGVDDFKDSKTKRMFGKHFVDLLEKIGKEEFRKRLEGILSDDFKARNCNSLKYLYREMKSFIHSPAIEKKKKSPLIF